MTSLQDLTGQRYGRLLVVGPPIRENGRTKWACRCDCGVTTAVNASSLRRGLTESCGCLRREVTNARSSTHGMAAKGKARSSEYNIWANMKLRCGNPRNPSYPRYGGRGISVCGRWHSFEAFLADMGPRPTPAHTIDRIDNDGDYEPGNCRWATKTEQANNTSTNWPVEYEGETLTLAEWSRRTGLRAATIQWRVLAGWPIADSLTRPPRPRRS